MTSEEPINDSLPEATTSPAKPSGNGWRTFGIVMITMVLTLGIGYWVFAYYLFPSSFSPVELSNKEQRVLDQKIERIGWGSSSTSTNANTMEPEAYNEAGASREIHFSEKELNALLANNTELASKLAIDLADDLASAKLLIDLDPDFPVLGGKTIKVSAGMELGVKEGKPSAILKGVSVWGVPLPNAWLGNVKNVDLFEEFGQSGGFWQVINEGVETIQIEEGQLMIRLQE